MPTSSKAPKRRKAPKRANNDYTIDDFVNDTGFEHMFSFLNVRRPAAAPPGFPAPSATAPLAPETSNPVTLNKGTPESPVIVNPGTPNLGTPELPEKSAVDPLISLDSANSGTPNEGTPELSDGPHADTPNLGTPVLTKLDIPPLRREADNERSSAATPNFHTPAFDVPELPAQGETVPLDPVDSMRADAEDHRPELAVIVNPGTPNLGTPELTCKPAVDPLISLDSANSGAPNQGTPELSDGPHADTPNLGAPVLTNLDIPPLRRKADNKWSSAATPNFRSPAFDAPELPAQGEIVPLDRQERPVDSMRAGADGHRRPPGSSTAAVLHPPSEPDPASANPGTPNTGAPNTGSPNAGTPEFQRDYSSLRVRIEPRPRPWRNVQDGHTHGEHRVYETLWRLAKPMAGSQSREVVIGVQTLADQVPMKYDNCRANLESLIEKLAIERRPAGSRQQGQYYISYSMGEILQRRREAGLTHVIKTTRAVRLCSSPNLGTLNAGTPELLLGPVSGTPNQGTPGFNAGTPNTGVSTWNPGVPVLGVPSRNNSIRKSSTPSKASPALVAALRRQTGRSDDDAAIRIAADCRALQPDLTDEEITHFIDGVGSIIAKSPSVINPTGLLIRMVPKSCVGESLRQYREQVRQAAERRAHEEARQQAELERLARDILDHSEDWPAEQAKWAADIMSGARK